MVYWQVNSMKMDRYFWKKIVPVLLHGAAFKIKHKAFLHIHSSMHFSLASFEFGQCCKINKCSLCVATSTRTKCLCYLQRTAVSQKGEALVHTFNSSSLYNRRFFIRPSGYAIAHSSSKYCWRKYLNDHTIIFYHVTLLSESHSLFLTAHFSRTSCP